MKEHPIPFSTEMVRAILDGRKTQTRRVVKRGHVFRVLPGGDLTREEKRSLNASQFHWERDNPAHPSMEELLTVCPYGVPGDRLWVRETFRVFGDTSVDKASTSVCVGPQDCEFRADFTGEELEMREWRPSIHMPRWASRILLEVTDVRVQRVQEISEADAKAEGWPYIHDVGGGSLATAWFQSLWDSINAKRGYPWQSNPWVWAISFRRVSSQCAS